VIVTCVSAWEAYLEELVREMIAALRPAAGPVGVWSPLSASAQGQLGRFNNPNVENVRSLMADTVGLANITAFWSWRNCTVPQAKERLRAAIRFRHQTAHGVKPRPTIHNQYSSRLPSFFRRLGQRTDAGAREHLVSLGVPNPWP
jgi:hypothetical protein